MMQVAVISPSNSPLTVRDAGGSPLLPGSSNIADELFHTGFFEEVGWVSPEHDEKATIELADAAWKSGLGEKRKRRVRFSSDGPQVSRTTQIRASSPEERGALWYTKEDLSDIKSSAKRFCQRLDMDTTLSCVYGDPTLGVSKDHSQSSLPSVPDSLRSKDFESQRGLERWSSKMCLLTRCTTIVRARTEVQLEQINQTILGKKDPQRIADLYKEASTQAGSFAHLLGLADAALLDAE